MPQSPVSADLLRWYDRHRRVLPWRAAPGETPDPYRVWLSEIMLQQTTVAAVGPYFQRFLARWPTVESLAAASWEELSAMWAGLGYYARARNLLACAREVAARGGFPADEAGLLALPGIGPYTAGAIAAIAFNRPAAAVDGNVERVVTRLRALETPLPQAKPQVRTHVLTLIPPDRPGDFAQAVMDLGATICTPRRPACALCPLREGCAACKAGNAEIFPVKAPRKLRPVRHGLAYLIERADGALLLRRRPAKGLLAGMAEIPGSDWLPTCPEPSPPLELSFRPLVGEVVHVFTHFELRVKVLAAHARMDVPPPDGCWWHPAETLAEAGLPSVMRKIAQALRTS